MSAAQQFISKESKGINDNNKNRKVDECTQSNGKLSFRQNQTDINIIYSTLSKHYFIVSLTLKFNLLRLSAHIDNTHTAVTRMKCHAFCCGDER